MTTKEIFRTCDRIAQEIDRNYFSTAAVAAHRIRFWTHPGSEKLLSDKERKDTVKWWVNRYTDTLIRARKAGLYIVWVPEDTENLL